MMSRRRKTGLVISLAGFAISVNILPSLVTWYATELRIPVERFGIIFLLQYASFTVCSLVLGKIHHRKTVPLLAILVSSLIISSIGLFFIGYAGSFSVLILFMIVIGGCGGLVESIGTTLLTDTADNGRMVYLSQFFYAIGACVAPLCVGVLLTMHFSIPTIGRLVGMFALLVGVLVWVLVQPSHSTRHAKEPIVSGNVPEARDPSDKKINAHARGYAWLLLTMAAYVVIESAIGNWLPVFIEEAYGTTSAEASFVLLAFWAGLGAARFVYVFIKKKSPQFPMIVHMAIVLISLISLSGLGNDPPLTLIMLIVALVGFGCGPLWPLLIEYCAGTYKDDHLIMYLVSAGSIGALLGPVVTSLFFSVFDVQSMAQILIGYTSILILFTWRSIAATPAR